jgi:hypothetical protein
MAVGTNPHVDPGRQWPVMVNGPGYGNPVGQAAEIGTLGGHRRMLSVDADKFAKQFAITSGLGRRSRSKER